QAQQFQPTGSAPVGFNTYTTIADFNLDGRPDLAVAAASVGKLKISFGNADGSFTQSAGPLADIDTPTGLVPGDFDNDGKTDLAILSSVLFGSPSARILLSSGSGTFA